MNTAFTAQERKQIKTAEIVSFIIASILGVIFHFVYNWSGQIRILGFFVPVNESIWEHLKLIFYPIIIVSLAEYWIGNIRSENFLCIKTRSIWVGMLSTVILFYTYSGVLGQVKDWINILIYFIAMGMAYCFSYRRLAQLKPTKSTPVLCIISLTVVAILFKIFSLYPPTLGIFAEP